MLISAAGLLVGPPLTTISMSQSSFLISETVEDISGLVASTFTYNES